MAQSQAQQPQQAQAAAAQEPIRNAASKSAPRTRLQIDATTPVSHGGCFDVDRVIKSGYVDKRTSKTKTWKTIYIVLRPNALYMYKNEKETKLRHQVHMSDLTAVAFLKDPKHKRQNVFGLFSPSKNFHLQAPTAKDAEEWVELIRKDARIEEEEEEMFLASPLAQRQSSGLSQGEYVRDERLLSSSPEPIAVPTRRTGANGGRRRSSMFESSGLSGTELASHSDFSDNDMQRLPGASIESLAVQPQEPGSLPRSGPQASMDRSLSQVSVTGAGGSFEPDPDRVVWQGWLWLLRTKGGVRQWKDMWGVLRPRNFILYKDGSEYAAQWLVQLSNIVDVVDIDPLTKSKSNCMQIITEEKSYRFCAHDEESLVQCLGAFKSLLARRRGLAARAAASGS